MRVATSAVELESLRPLWEKLSREPQATIFQSYQWNIIAARSFADREAPYVIALEDEVGAVIVPASRPMKGGSSATFLGERLFDYRDVLAVGDTELIQGGLDQLSAAGYELWLPAIWEDSLLLTSGCGKPSPWVGAPYLRRVDMDPDAFLAQHFKARKQMRRLVRAGAEFRRYDGGATGLLRSIYARKATQFASSDDIFSDPRRRDCMVEIAGAWGKKCDIFTIEFGSAMVAALVAFRDREVRRFYTIWHDSRWRQFSPGIVMLLHACQASLTEGLDVDFLTGEQPHKTRFAAGSTQLYRFNASPTPALEPGTAEALIA